ncbi:flagellar hook-basal body complex protein FliE [Pokkaliibacter sp. MBI-7]|uniref:flagellar hook-basal body complex protein FliE n=1 Tax=Pokkaliibacter sp. MBI-7 TaxID=3040600 RepID=UPI00244BCF4D|nr:flagellar hook-basal body complex protein FliE [Pokkaliibacter sp. MBI-7]MDH2431268.1 flagellar hook-basal body complex protein FliE [Pokkaliibacter sp. MBI-7]
MADRADIQSVLSQMRTLQAQVQKTSVPKPDAQSVDAVTQSSELPSFADMLNQAVNSVSEQQNKANSMSTAYEQGDPSVDLPQVMIELQKASISFDAMTQVRNRLVDAYKEIMSMTV